jgi:predicted DNA-binding protein (MmcQ/YjbR family)
MNLDSLRAHCLSFPNAAEKVQWEDHLLFTIGGKMFVITSFEPGPFVVTLKPDPEHRLELLEIEGVEPAPYLAKAGWISIRQWDSLRDAEWRELVAESYRMVLAKLPKKLQAKLAGETGDAKEAASSKAALNRTGKKAAKPASKKRPATKKSGAKKTAKKKSARKLPHNKAKARAR